MEDDAIAPHTTNDADDVDPLNTHTMMEEARGPPSLRRLCMLLERWEAGYFSCWCGSSSTTIPTPTTSRGSSRVEM